MELEILYKLDYNSLKDFLLSHKNIAKDFLKDTHLKEILINPTNKYEFIWFAQDYNNDLLPFLLDDEGINILKNSEFFEDKMNGLITSCNPCLSTLFKNENFNELILDNIKILMFYLKSLQPESALNLMKYIEKNKDRDLLNKAALFFNEETTLFIVKNFNLTHETKLKIVKNYKKAAEYLLNNDLTISTLSVFSISDLYHIFKSDIQISPHLLEEKQFIDKITTTPQTKEYRFIITELSKSNDVSQIEEKRKKYYESQIKSYIKEHDMLKNYYECYQYLSSLSIEEIDLYKKIKEAVESYLNIVPSTEEYLNLSNKIFELLNQENKTLLKSFFKKESSIQLSNMIIDYHFEEISYNLFLDLKQLLNFQKTEGKTLSDEDIQIYNKILHLDSLSYKEKLELHETLKMTNFIEKYYDDMRNAKNKANQLIKEQMLTKYTIQKYKDDKLSKQHGIDVYILDKDPFYVLVKSLDQPKTTYLDQNSIYYTRDGVSYSLDSSSKLNTFYNPKENYNIAYTDFEINQIVHIFATDSYSNYNRDIKLKPTDRIYELRTPESLSNEYEQYNEILIAQKNDRRQNELNEKLKIPEMFAIYCYDTITENDIISAKNLGLGIILVKTKAYEDKKNIAKKNMYDTLGLNDGYKKEITYLDKITQDDKFNRRK